MTKQINEADVNLDITGLSSSDLQTLSQILSLAGTADNSTTDTVGMGGYQPMSGPVTTSDASPIAAIELGSTDDVMTPGTEMSGGMDEMGADALGMPEENPISAINDETDHEFISELGDSFDSQDPDDNGIPGDQRDDMEDISIEISPEDEIGDNVMDDFMEDLDRLGKLTGLTEDKTEEDTEEDLDLDIDDEELEQLDEEVQDDHGHKGVGQIEDTDSDNSVEGSEYDEEYEDEDESILESLLRLSGVRGHGEVIFESDETCECEDGDCTCDEDKEKVDENMRLMPNLDLDEDAVGEMKSLGLGANKLYGPYANSVEASSEAKNHLGGGTVGVNFKLINKPDGVYWSEKVNEDCARPNPEEVSTTAIRNNRHAIKDKDAKLGDNTMKMPVSESVQDLHESLNSAFSKFLGK
ncbi:hypothetical protein NVP2275O_389 [Vibrio phage 2.275.O._10N.286.54.E11]|nr:hypothetical protein NVP2275O_389 [Vibrio phage 2.275.O._10N.286.54.E11]